MSHNEKIGFIHLFIGLVGGYMSLMVGDTVGILSLIAASANTGYACLLLLGSNVAD
jgi:hypothetical protein